MPKKQKGLNSNQMSRLSGMKIKAQTKGFMVRHAKAKLRSVVHNNFMLKELAKGQLVAKAHDKALKEVGL